MSRSILVCVGLLFGFASLHADEGKKPNDLDKLKSEIEGLKLSLEAEQQKSTTLQKLNDAQRTLNQEMQKQIEELRKSLELTAQDRDARLVQLQLVVDGLKVQLSKQNKDRDEAMRNERLREEQIPTLKKEIESLRQLLIAEQLKARALQDRNDAVVRQLEEVNKQLTQIQAKTPAKPVSLVKSKPAIDLNGKVTEIDASRQLLVVNLGSDSGLKPGDTLELYRIAADPKASLYLGQVTVLKTTETSSVGRYTSVQPERLPQLNDTVSTNLNKWK